jgi:LmbE family N-acetylglucosaminyl deacetylase
MSRAAVLAPHPDDEVLGCTSVLTEQDVVVVHVTDGVPVGIAGHEAVALAAAREQEARDACAVLHARVERFVTLDARDQELWCSTIDVARALVELLPTLDVDAVYAPALQSGHPDHDGLYVAAQLTRTALPALDADWWCYALYALDELGRPGYGWLHPALFPDVLDRVFTADETARKSAALRTFATQVHPESVVQSWLDAPAPERFAPMPARDAPLPQLRSYYDEIFRFSEQGIDRGTVDHVLRTALSGI